MDLEVLLLCATPGAVMMLLLCVMEGIWYFLRYISPRFREWDNEKIRLIEERQEEEWHE